MIARRNFFARSRRRVVLIISEVDVLVVPSALSTEMGGSITVEPSSIVVRIRTQAGHEGLGVATANLGGRAVGLAVAEIRPFLIGQDAVYRERLWQRLLEVSIVVYPPQVLAAVDCALWDLAGRAAGLPVYQLLGAYRDSVPAYASTLTYRVVEEYLAVIDECLDRGFRAVKLHGWGDPNRDIPLCETVRAHVGSEVGLMLDAVGAYDLPGALRVGRALDRLGFEWFEMPIRDQDLFGYQQLAAALDLPITSGEVHTHGFQEASNYLVAKAWDIIRIDACISGGITGARKAAAVAEGFGVRCEIHSFGTSLAQAANLQVIGSIPNCKYFEVPLPLGGYDHGNMERVLIDSDGNAHVPQGPGLGVNISWEELERGAVARY